MTPNSRSYLNQFSQPDTIVPNPYNSQSWNRYAYGLNNPIRYNDPSGHCATGAAVDTVFCIFVAAMVVGAVADASINAYNQYQDTGHIDSGEVLTHAWEGALIGGGVVIGVTAVAALLPAAGAIGKAACSDGDCTNEVNTVSQGIYRNVKTTTSLPAGEGFTDKYGNSTISSLGSQAQQTSARYHEAVHSFFTPRGPFLEARTDFRLWMYDRSQLVRYTEEALSESVAQLRTGGSLMDGLKFPIVNTFYKINPAAVVREATVVGTTISGGLWWIYNKLRGGSKNNMFRRILRHLDPHPPLISAEEAEIIAREECKKRGWTWLEPVKVELKWDVWVIKTNWGNMGVNATIHIDHDTGDVVRGSYIPR